MEKWQKSLLTTGERVIDDITAIFEVKETIGLTYKFGNLIATDKRLIMYTKYPFIGLRETTVYDYHDIFQIDTMKSLFSLKDGNCVVVKLVNEGSAKPFLETIKLFSNQVPGIRNFYQKD